MFPMLLLRSSVASDVRAEPHTPPHTPPPERLDQPPGKRLVRTEGSHASHGVRSPVVGTLGAADPARGGMGPAGRPPTEGCPAGDRHVPAPGYRRERGPAHR